MDTKLEEKIKFIHEHFIEFGELPTVRHITDQTGGSFTTASKALAGHLLTVRKELLNNEITKKDEYPQLQKMLIEIIELANANAREKLSREYSELEAAQLQFVQERTSLIAKVEIFESINRELNAERLDDKKEISRLNKLVLESANGPNRTNS